MGSRKAKKPENPIGGSGEINEVLKANTGRYGFLKKYLFLPFFLLFCLFTYRFYSRGVSGYTVTIVCYLGLMALAWGHIGNRVVRFNILAVLILFFTAESYLRVLKKGKLNYSERDSASAFENYVSLGYSDVKYYDGLYVNKPNSILWNKKAEYSYEHVINEVGLRERPLDSFSGKRNILVLGDSFTEGAGAPADSTGPAALQYFLGQAGYPHRVVNAGVSGSDLFFAYRILERIGPELHPELVILHLNSSDAFDVIVRGDDARFSDTGYRNRKQFWWEYPFSFSYILREIMVGGFHMDPNDYFNPEESRFVIPAIVHKIIDYKNWCLAHHAKFVLVNVPGPVDLINRDNFIESLMSYPAMDPGIPLIYLRSYMIDLIQKQGGNIWYYYYPLDLHLRPVGYWAWGKAVAHDLRSMGLLDTLPQARNWNKKP